MELQEAIVALKEWAERALRADAQKGLAFRPSEAAMVVLAAIEQPDQDLADAKHRLSELRKTWERIHAYRRVIDGGCFDSCGMSFDSRYYMAPEEEQLAMARAGEKLACKRMERLLSKQPQDPPDAK